MSKTPTVVAVARTRADLVETAASPPDRGVWWRTLPMSPSLMSLKKSLEGPFTPRHRVGEPEDIAHAVLSLTDPGNSNITGAVIRVDGGQLAMLPMPWTLAGEGTGGQAQRVKCAIRRRLSSQLDPCHGEVTWPRLWIFDPCSQPRGPTPGATPR